MALEIVGGAGAGRWQGLAAMAIGCAGFLGPWEDLRIDVVQCEHLGGQHVVALTHTTHASAGSSDRQGVGTNPAVLFQVDDGKVARVVMHWDGDSAIAALGLAV